jgi:hypothetical protein
MAISAVTSRIRSLHIFYFYKKNTMATVSRTAIHPLPDYFDRYIVQAPSDDLLDALVKDGELFRNLDWDRLHRIGFTVYAPGKWTVHDLFQHLIDTERIFCYRALRFARNDSTALASYDEDAYVSEAVATKRSLDELKEEFLQLRAATLWLFRSFSAEMLQRKGICFEREMSVGSIGFTIAGHVQHHLKVLQERYYGLVE